MNTAKDFINLVAALLFIALPLVSICQVQLGVKLGGNLTDFSRTIRGEDIEERGIEYQSRLGFQLGATAGWYISDRTTLLTELVYSRIGTKHSGNNFDANLYYDYYLLPITLNHKIGSKFFIEGGYEIGLLKITRYKFYFEPQDYTQLRRSPRGDADFIHGVNLGAGMNLSEKVSVLLWTTPFGRTIYKRSSGSKKSFSTYQLSVRYNLFGPGSQN